MLQYYSISLDCIRPDDFIEIFDVLTRACLWSGKFNRCPARLGCFIVCNLRCIGVPGLEDSYQWHISVIRPLDLDSLEGYVSDPLKGDFV